MTITRKRLRAFLALAGVTVAAAYGTTAARSTAEAKLLPQRFTLYTAAVAGKDAPLAFEAAGAISGVGSATQTAKNMPGGRSVNYVTLRFADGTVRFVAPERSGWKIDRESCTAKAFGSGTFRLTGGTGAYRGARGSGRFSSRGVAVGARTGRGACLADKAAPVVNYVTVSLTGKATLGS